MMHGSHLELFELGHLHPQFHSDSDGCISMIIQSENWPRIVVLECNFLEYFASQRSRCSNHSDHNTMISGSPESNLRNYVRLRRGISVQLHYRRVVESSNCWGPVNRLVPTTSTITIFLKIFQAFAPTGAIRGIVWLLPDTAAPQTTRVHPLVRAVDPPRPSLKRRGWLILWMLEKYANWRMKS